MSSKYLKIKYENKCKMISTPKSFFEFVEIVKNNLDLSNNKHYQFSYLDDENDNVLISSKEDYDILLELSQIIKRPIKIIITEQKVKNTLTLNLTQTSSSSLDSYSLINKYNNNMNQIAFKQLVNEMRNKYDLSHIKNDEIILHALIKVNGNKEEALKLLEEKNDCNNKYYTINQFNNGMNEVAFKQLVNEMRNKYDLSKFENDDIILQFLIEASGDKEKAFSILKFRD